MRLQYREALSDLLHRPIRVAQQDLKALYVAGDIPGCEPVLRALRDGPRVLEQLERLARVAFHGLRVVRIERRKMRASVGLGQLRRGPVEGGGAEDVEDLHENVVVATALGRGDGPVRQRRDRAVLPPRKQHGVLAATCKRDICPIAATPERAEQLLDR